MKKRPIRIIPCLDAKGGRVVKGVRFTSLRDIGDPATLAAAYEAQGADELALLDIAATDEGRPTSLSLLGAVRRSVSIPILVGGGVRSEDDAARLLDVGADRVSIGTAALERPALLDAVAARFGADRIVVAIDAARGADGGFEVVSCAGRKRMGRPAVDFAKEATERGAGELLLTSVDRDGTRQGYDLELLAEVAAAVPLPVIASGGAATVRDLVDGVNAGAAAVLAASLFHDGDRSVAEVKRALGEAGIGVRL